MNLLMYDMGDRVEAYSTMRNAILPYPVLQPHQVHGDGIKIICDRTVVREQLQGVDALITSLKDFPIGVRTADCIPVLLYDQVNDVIAAVHCGWRGTVARLSASVIEKMKEEFGTDPKNVKAVIGPGIGPESFQVGTDVVSFFTEAGFKMDQILIDEGPKSIKKHIETCTCLLPSVSPMRGGLHIDLWKANQLVLEDCGVHKIFTAGICTFLRNDLFYSARRETINCERIITSIKLL